MKRLLRKTLALLLSLILIISILPAAAAAEEPQTGVNYALQATATASDQYGTTDQYGPAKANDGIGAEPSRWATNAARPADGQRWLQMTLDHAVTINKAVIRQYYGANNYIEEFDIEYWENDGWQTAYSTNEKPDPTAVVHFPAVTSDRFRLNVRKDHSVTIYEFELYYDLVDIVGLAEVPQTGSCHAGVSVLHAPGLVSGTWRSPVTGEAAAVELEAVRDGEVVTTAQGVLEADGSWSAQLDDPALWGAVTLTANLLDAEGKTLGSSLPVNVLYRGYEDLARGKSASCSSDYAVYGLTADQALDGKTGTRWAPQDSDGAPVLTVELGEGTVFNTVVVRETYDSWAKPARWRSTGYKLEAEVDGVWTELAGASESIGEELILSFRTPVKAPRVRLTTTGVLGTSLETFEVYNIPVEGQTEHTITVSDVEHGTVVTKPAGAAVTGERVHLSARPAPGYGLVPGSLQVNGTAVSGAAFEMPDEDVTITARFEAREGAAVNHSMELSAYDPDLSRVAETVTQNENAADFTALGGSFAAGDYLVYPNLDFANGEFRTMLLWASANRDQAGKKIEIRLDSADGEKLGEISLPNTDNEQVFLDLYIPLAEATGTHDLYLVFPKAATAQLDWFMCSGYDGTETEAAKAARMAWWSHDRFGMFIHFGAYAYLAGEYPAGVQAPGLSEWIMEGAKVSKTDYAEAVKGFNPVNFDAEKIVSLAKAAGQKYIVFTSRHHEGVSMFDTKVRTFKDYSIYSDAFPQYTEGDLMKALSEECQKQGIKFCTYLTIWDWHDPSQDDWGSTLHEEQKADFVYRLKSQIRELIEVYGINILWLDGQWPGWWNGDAENTRNLYRFARTLKADIIVNNRVGGGYGDYGTPEQTIPETGLPGYWESCLTMTGHWGYNKFKHNFHTTDEVIEMVVKCASGGGNALLNVGPMPDGSITPEETEILTRAGTWMQKYGDSIYGTQANVLAGLPQGVRATTKEGKMYLHLMNHMNGDFQIPNLANEIYSVKVMGTDQEVPFERSKMRTTLFISGIEQDPYDTVLEFTVDGMPEAMYIRNYAPDAASVTASNVYHNDPYYAAREAVDGDSASRWATDESATGEYWLELGFDAPVTLNAAAIKQYEERMPHYTIDYWDGEQWVTAYAGQQPKGEIVSFPAFTSDKVRLNVPGGDRVSIYEFELYNLETYSVAITTPAYSGPTGNMNESVSVLGAAPITVAGTWSASVADAAATVELRAFQDGKEPQVCTAELKADGTWHAALTPEFEPGDVSFTAYLRDAEGVLLGVSNVVPAIYRGRKDLALGKPVTVSSDWGETFNGAKAVDGMTGTRWAPRDTAENPVMTVNLGEETEFNKIIIREMHDAWSGLTEYRCRAYTLEALVDGQWTILSTGDGIGENLELYFGAVTATQLRLTMTTLPAGDRYYAPGIETFEVYNIAVEPVTVTLTGADVAYTDGGDVTYTASVANAEKLATATLTFEVDAACFTEPVVTGLNGFEVLATKVTERDGKKIVKTMVYSLAGLTGEEAVEIAALTVVPAGGTGKATVSVAEAKLSIYVGEAEAFAPADLTQSTVVTEVKCSIYDVNEDGVVNQLDVTRAQRHYGTSHPICDVNGDGEVNIADLILILNHYSE